MALVVALWAMPAVAQVTPSGPTTQAVSLADNAARLLGQITFVTPQHVIIDSSASIAVTGTFWQGTQPVSGTFWQATQPVSGTFWQATQPVSGTVTANQGGTWTVQPGNTANTTAWKVDGSAVTQPVSGTFWPTAAGSPGSARLSDGAAFYNALKSSETLTGVTTVATLTSVTNPISTKTGLTAAAPAAASVGVASATAVAANASRKGLIAVNTSANTVSCTGSGTAVLNSGVTLYPGGTWNMNEYSFTTSAINCIASSAASNLSVQEF